jgi:hypothetical protein
VIAVPEKVIAHLKSVMVGLKCVIVSAQDGLL